MRDDCVGKGKFYELYGKALAEKGVTPIPLALFRYQRKLGLTFQELAFVCHLLSYRWTSEGNPRPSLERLSELTGISTRTLHTYKESLVEKGLMKVYNRQTTTGGKAPNDYDLTPLFTALEEVIEAESRKEEAEHGCGTSQKDDEGGICKNFTSPYEGRENSSHTRGVYENISHTPGVCENSSHTHMKRRSGTSCRNFTYPHEKVSHELDQDKVDQRQVDQEKNKQNDSAEIDSSSTDQKDRSIYVEIDDESSGRLIAVLVARLQSIQGVEKSRSHYPLVGRALRDYGREAVERALDDLEWEAIGRQQLGQPAWDRREVCAAFMARCRWNYRPSRSLGARGDRNNKWRWIEDCETTA
ncbi:MAG: helix-turn-helix domain-containing protein [Anaerolineae bacterium]